MHLRKKFLVLISWCHLKGESSSVLNQCARSVDNNRNSGTATVCYLLPATGESDLTIRLMKQTLQDLKAAYLFGCGKLL